MGQTRRVCPMISKNDIDKEVPSLYFIALCLPVFDRGENLTGAGAGAGGEKTKCTGAGVEKMTCTGAGVSAEYC